MEHVTTSTELLLWEAIDQVREAEDGTDLSMDELAECVMAALGSSLSLQQICRAADGLLHLADDPSQGSAARLVPVVDVQAVQERALNLLDWQELEDDDDRSDIQKLIDNSTDADTVLVRDPTSTPELQEIGILELLQRYPCRGSEARWSPDDAIAFLETKTRWLDAALESWEAVGEAMADDSDLIEATAVVLVVPEQAGQPLRTELLDVLIPVDS
ncbi:hypothetical protein [Synechococcus sp. 1G10]|uniref:hypothetical protein n=1 Tax=Synechococcus sp. 1G10 TaxID=2025605 RepID=UPI000B98EDA9|nr:hypothetical protein [Synechococcus sp. 1G10]